MDELIFRCSSLANIMGKCKDSAGLTDSQEIDLKYLFEKEKLPTLTEKQIQKVKDLESKKEASTITEKQISELEKLLIKSKAPKLTPKQAIKKLELIAKRDYKTEFDLSVGAKTHIRNIVKGIAYGFKKQIDGKPLMKGNMVEDDSIKLYNLVNFTKYEKNTISKNNGFIKGTCDIDDEIESLITDIKSSWTLETFPVLSDEIEIGNGEWQCRGYMMLWEREKSQLAYCMVDTPDSLLDYEPNLDIHHVSHIEPELRVTTLGFDRCEEKEELIKYKVKEARKYAVWYHGQIEKKYG